MPGFQSMYYPDLTLRPIEPGDEPFLRRLYASTREAEMAQVDWNESQKQVFLKSQFDGQHSYYQQEYPDAEFQIIELHREPVGRLYVERRPDEIRIMDMALLPEHRNHGIGSVLLGDLLKEAADAGKPARAHVEIFNQGSLRWCQRLGFSIIENRGMYAFIEWRSPSS